MNFVKTNLYLIICGVVVLLAIGARFWPLASWQEDLQTQMNTRIGKVTEVRKLTQDKITVIPGGTPIAGPVVRKVIDVREEAQREMRSQASQIAEMASGQNLANRATWKGNRTNPMLGGKELIGYLPELAPGVDPHDYKEWYLDVTGKWPLLLANTKEMGAAAPTQVEVDEAMKAYERNRIANAPVYRGAPVPDMPGIASASGTAKLEFTKKFVSDRASSIRMYVTLDSFDRETWANSTGAPNEAQIFESLVRCWLQQDVVNAIAEVNGTSKDVGQSAIKRLESIKVGNETGGALFQVSSSAGGAGPGVRPVAGAAPAAEAFRTMTGRVSTNEYDVVVMTVTMVIDPAKLNTFIQKLYLQNNGYTVLNVKQTTVDPFQAASEGYLYGETQCVRAEVQVEALLFRKWTAPMMPETIRVQLGVPAATTK